jgi:ADP-heptose:LPS heptosyltransferase
MKISLMRKIDYFIGGGLCIVLDLMERLKRVLPQKKTMPEPRSVLVTKYLGMGSILLATPALQALKDVYPSCRIVLLTFEENDTFARKLPLFDSVITIRSTSLLNLVINSFTALIDIRRQRFDYLLDLEFFARYSTIISYLSGATCRVGYYMPQIWRGDLLHIPVHFNPYRHVSEIFAAQVEAIGVPVTDYSVSPLAVSSDAVARVIKLLESAEITEKKPLILININASDLSLERRWPRQNFIRLMEEVASQGSAAMILIGSPREEQYVTSLYDALSAPARQNTLNLAGATDLDQLLALLSLSTLFITNDSGPLHMAAALGRKTLSFFGPESPQLYGPAGDGHTIFYAGIYCSPCLNVFNAKKAMCNSDNKCMQAIDPGQVIEAVLSDLAKQGSA